jgi:hypothetical protein
MNKPNEAGKIKKESVLTALGAGRVETDTIFMYDV